jgi:hypothetical protein
MMDNIKKVIVYAREILKAQRPQRWPEIEALINQAELDAQHYEWELASARAAGINAALDFIEKWETEQYIDGWREMEAGAAAAIVDARRYFHEDPRPSAIRAMQQPQEGAQE